MIDLHFHSVWSDGHYTTDEILTMAEESAMSAIALTDHDEIRGFLELQEFAEESDVEIIPGVEISTTVDDSWAHILAYGFDPENADFLAMLKQNRLAKQQQIQAMLSKLRNFGIELNFEELIGDMPDDAYVGRGIIADALVPHVFERSSTVFRRYIGRQGSCYVSAKTIDASEAIEVIHEAGGVAVFAHPRFDDLQYALPRLVPAGLDGIERYRQRCTRQLEEAVQTAAVYDKLFVTGGSDWHGRKYDEDLGYWGIPKSRLDQFFTRLSQCAFYN